jgi:short-subunit dehydrogenase
MTSFFQNKTVLITGGTEGIGKALVIALLANGAKVATCGRNTDKLYRLRTEYAGRALHTVVADVSSYDDCQHLVNSTIDTFGGIDILINNAGMTMRSLMEDTDVSVIRKLMDVNFFGTVNCTKLALPSIMQRKGTIVGISSVAGYRGLPSRSGYSASKFALQGWLEAVRTELLDSGVNVMWISPGYTTSNIRNAALDQHGKPTGESHMDEGNMMPAEEVAVHVLKAIEKRKRSLVLTFTGKRAVFMNRFFPSLTDRLVRNFYFKDGQLVK